MSSCIYTRKIAQLHHYFNKPAPELVHQGEFQQVFTRGSERPPFWFIVLEPLPQGQHCILYHGDGGSRIMGVRIAELPSAKSQALLCSLKIVH